MKIPSFAIKVAAAAVVLLTALDAHAQATRTWVSGVGDDANPCSRTAPCKTFAGAISKTASGGEINVLDGGGYGAVTITKSITIRGDNDEAGVLVSGTSGIIVNAGPADNVTLSGLDIEGVGTGLNGIRFIAGKALHVRNCRIHGFGGSPGHGIAFAPGSAADLFVTDTVISDNADVAIEVVPTGSGGATVSLFNVHAENNRTGFRGNGTQTTGSIFMTIKNSVVSGNSGAGINATDSGGGSVQLMLKDVVSANNGRGIRVDGAAAIVRVGDSVVTGNSLEGTSAVNSGTVASYGQNQIDGNGIDSSPPVISLK